MILKFDTKLYEIATTLLVQLGGKTGKVGK